MKAEAEKCTASYYTNSLVSIKKFIKQHLPQGYFWSCFEQGYFYRYADIYSLLPARGPAVFSSISTPRLQEIESHDCVCVSVHLRV